MTGHDIAGHGMGKEVPEKDNVKPIVTIYVRYMREPLRPHIGIKRKSLFSAYLGT